MKTRNKLAGALAALTALGAVAFACPAGAQTTPPAPFGRPQAGRGERHPELRRALASLERTETLLRRSSRDFGGHREKAADLCHQAENEIQQALQYDKH